MPSGPGALLRLFQESFNGGCRGDVVVWYVEFNGVLSEEFLSFPCVYRFFGEEFTPEFTQLGGLVVWCVGNCAVFTKYGDVNGSAPKGRPKLVPSADLGTTSTFGS